MTVQPAQAERACPVWDACYVCQSQDLPEGYDLKNPLCAAHQVAREHVISMRSDRVICRCGWAEHIPMRSYAERERACRKHWLAVTEFAS